MAELKFTKGTDEEHEVKLDSKLISATWTQSLATGGKTAAFQIRTCFVGEGAPVKVVGKSANGKKLGKIKGVMAANTFCEEFDIPEDIEIGDEVFFEFELSKNSIDGESDHIPAVPPLTVTNMKWSAREARRGDTLTLTSDIKGVRNGTEVRVVIYEYDERGADDRIAEIPTLVSDNKIEVSWEYEYHEDTDEIPSQSELDQYGGAYNPPEYYFVVKYGGVEYGRDRASGLLMFKDVIEIKLVDRDGEPKKGEKYEVTLPDGSKKEGKLDGQGLARIEDVPPGPYRVWFPDSGGARGLEDEEEVQA